MHTPVPDDQPTALLGRDAGAEVGGREFQPGQRIGPYHLLEQLGEGGMGQVFLAEQTEPIRRKVALKLIRRQLAGSLAEAYFEVERQALARMEHPAIAKVFDAGRTSQGYPYFVMERVDGRTLDQWRREDQPDVRTRLRALIALAYGVQHAHQRGIVHRDLKPSNVLMPVVDGRAQPKLIDFGIAVGVDQETAPGERTHYERAGSGYYMSPEQFAASGRGIDTRTDVYSLGVILLDLLLPLPGLHALGEPLPQREQLHARLNDSLTQPQRDPVLRALPFELRHIAARAIHPQREQRYASAMALAEDMQRYLDGHAVAAVPASKRYQLRKFVARQRRVLTLVALAALALVAGLAVAVWGLRQAEQEARQSRAIADFLGTVLAGVDPDRARDMDKTLLRSVLDEAGRRAADELGDQPETLAEIEGVIAESYFGLGEYDQSLVHARHAYELSVAEHGPDDPRSLIRARGYARTQVDTGAAKDAEPLLRATIASLQRQLGADALPTLRARQTLSWALRETGQYPAAHAEAADAAARLRSAFGDEHDDTLETRFALAIVLGDLERYDEAATLLNELITVRSRISGPEHARTLSLRNSLAVNYLQSQQFAKAEVELKALLPLFEQVFGKDSSTTVMISNNLGGALREQGKVAESGPYYLRAAEANLAQFGPRHPRALMSRHNYGNYLLDAGRFEEAYAAQKDAVDNGLAAFGEKHPVRAEALTGLGRAATALQRYAEAETALLAALAMKQELLGEDSGRLQSTRDALVKLYLAWGRPQQAERYRQPADSATAAQP